MAAGGELEGGELHVWNVLVPDTNKAVDKYFAQIVEVIAANLTSELEAKEVNYLSVRLANDGAVQEKLDLARIAAEMASNTTY